MACTDSMNAMLVYTASSCGVSASGIRLTAPTVPWMVSSRVSPVNTRMVSCFSCSVSVFHDGMSLDTGTFSGSQKFPVSRSQTSASFSSGTRFQLIADTRSTSFTLAPSAGLCGVAVMVSASCVMIRVEVCTDQSRLRRTAPASWHAGSRHVTTDRFDTRCCDYRLARTHDGGLRPA